MISNIIVPTDFSEVANNATQIAKGIAAKCNATLHILHVKQIPVLDTQMPSDTYQMYMEEMEQATKLGFEKLENTILADKKVAYKFVTATGFVYDEIHKSCEDLKADMIVIGTTGASGLQGIFFGSNAASVINKSEIPVLVVPPSATTFEPHNILYSTDYTDPEFPAISRLVFLANLYQAKLTVMHVRTDFDRYFNAENNFFARNKKHIALNDIKIETIENEEITHAINRYIDEKKADMVAVAKHNRGFFDRLFHRSLSKQLAYNTKVPLLVLHKA